MLATVRPITDHTKLGKKVVSSVIVNQDLPKFHTDAYNKFLAQVENFIFCIMNDTITTRIVDFTAKKVAHAWFKYLTSYIIENATSNPMFANNLGGHSIISSADIVWSIQNLSSTTYLQALAYCFCKVILVQQKKNDSSDLKKNLPPYFLELGERSVKKFNEKCWRSCSAQNSFKSCAMSCEGILVLFRWIREILSMIMQRADSRNLDDGVENLRFISPDDMMWAFNWRKLHQLSNELLSSDFHESIGASNGQQLKSMRNWKTSKEQPPKEDQLPLLPDDLLESLVLPKLPFDSLLRFKSVCKNWKEKISSSYFQYLSQKQEDHQIKSFGIFTNHELALKQVGKCDGLELVAIDTTSLMDMYNSSFNASCNGFLCLTCFNDSTFMFNIGNPVTGEWNSFLPPFGADEFRPMGPGLAVNLSNNPPWYKLVIIACKDKQHLFYVFSSGTGEWKASNAMLPQFKIGEKNTLLQRQGNSVYINGLLYWITSGFQLFWFDLERDVAGLIALPAKPFFLPVIGSLETPGEGHRLTCSINVCNKRFETYCLFDKNQWKKLLSFSIRDNGIKPFPYMGGAVQLIYRNKRLVAYNIPTGRFRILIDDSNQILYKRLFPYKMSIFPLLELC